MNTNIVISYNDFKTATIKTNLSDNFFINFALKANETALKSIVKHILIGSYCER